MLLFKLPGQLDMWAWIGSITRLKRVPDDGIVSDLIINTAVVPAPIEHFFYFNDPLFISTVIVISQ